MLREFKEFALRGNVVDLAVGVIIGAAFGKIITSLVDDVIMPPIGLALGGVSFENLFVTIGPGEFETLAAAKAAGAATINYGLFLSTVLDFILVAFVIFFVIRRINRWKSAPEETTPTSKKCPFCISTVPLQATRCSQCTSQLDVA